MGREIRRVPANWDHPKRWVETHTGACMLRYKPLHDRNYDDDVATYEQDLAEWLEGQRHWANGMVDDEPKEQVIARHREYLDKQSAQYRLPHLRTAEYLKFSEGPCYWSDWAGDPPQHPSPEDYMPSGEWWQLFENVSEGTPQSPPFATADELVAHLTTEGDFRGDIWSEESARGLVEAGWMPSFVISIPQPES